MIRRDMVVDPDRPHYYSQFWVDVASGKHTASPDAEAAVEAAPSGPVALMEAPAADLDTDLNGDLDLDAIESSAEPEPIAPARPAPSKKADAKKAEPKKAEPITSLADLAKIDMMMKNSAEMDSDTIPDIAGAVASRDNSDIITDFDVDNVEPEAEEPLDAAEAEFGDEDYDEQDDWGEGENEPRRGSKPNKRRDTRRDSRDVRRDF